MSRISSAASSLGVRKDTTEDDFLDSAWQEYNLPDEYKDRFFSNPDYKLWLEYRKKSGFLSGLSENLFGSSSASRRADQYRESMYTYWNKLQQEYFSNKYNSPLAMAGRERVAGINPNIAGLDQANEDVGNPDLPFGNSLEDNSSDMSALGSAINPILDIAQTYISLRTGFANLRSIDIQNANNSASGLASIADFARASALDSITPDDFVNYQNDKDTFLNGVLVQAESLANNYFGEDYPNYRTARKIFKNAFNQHRASVFANSKSYEEFSKLRQSQLDASSFDYDMQNGITRSTLNLKLLRSQIESRYARLESKLLNNPDYTKLWNDERFASIRASIEQSHESEMQSGFNAEVWQQVSQSDTAISDASNAILEDFKARISEAIASAKESDLRAADAAVIQSFNDYLFNNGAYKTNNMYDAGSKNRTLYRGASARFGAYAEYLPVTLDDLLDTSLQIKNFESRARK